MFTVSIIPKEDEYVYTPTYNFDWYNPRQISMILQILERQEKWLRKALEVQGGLSVYEKTKEEFNKFSKETEREDIEEQIEEVEDMEEFLDLLNLQRVE